ncbi:MAG TPA: hypothetical protein VNT81_19005 [Vicinamibacterales bacterium]|nr:hypothetical protein [Vicinamibacterales bacterium]
MANDSRDPQKSGAQATPQQSGDNRRAGDTDGNAAAGNTKSKGATDPADKVPEAARKGDAEP